MSENDQYEANSVVTAPLSEDFPPAQVGAQAETDSTNHETGETPVVEGAEASASPCIEITIPATASVAGIPEPSMEETEPSVAQLVESTVSYAIEGTPGLSMVEATANADQGLEIVAALTVEETPTPSMEETDESADLDDAACAYTPSQEVDHVANLDDPTVSNNGVSTF
jgi:hypothetical protein